MYLLSKPIFRAKWLTYAELKVLVDLKVFTKPSKLHSNQKSLSISFPCWNIHQSSSENSALASCLHHPPPQLLKKTSSPLFKPLCKCPPLSCPGDLIISHFFHSSILYASLIPDFCRACPPHTHPHRRDTKNVFWPCSGKPWSLAAPTHLPPPHCGCVTWFVCPLPGVRSPHPSTHGKQWEAPTFVSLTVL